MNMGFASRSAALLAAAALLASSCATGAPAGAVHEEEGEGAYVIVEEDASIFPANNINGFEVVDRDTLLLRVGAGRLYLADVWRPCARDLRYEQSIAIDHRGSSSVDDFAMAIVNGQRCPMRNLRRVERKPAEAAAAPAEAAPDPSDPPAGT